MKTKAGPSGGREKQPAAKHLGVGENSGGGGNKNRVKYVYKIP